MPRTNNKRAVDTPRNGKVRRDARATLLSTGTAVPAAADRFPDTAPTTAPPASASSASPPSSEASPLWPSSLSWAELDAESGPPDLFDAFTNPGPPPLSEQAADAEPESELFGLRAAVDVPAEEPLWGLTLRRFARVGVWAMLAGAGVLALSGLWGWPHAAQVPGTGLSPGRWLTFTAVGLALSLLGLMSLAALLATTRSRHVAAVGVVLAVLGTVLVMPAAGLIALARPTVQRLGPAAGAAFDHDVMNATATRWLGIGGLLLLALGWLAFGWAIIASRILNGMDGVIILGSVGLAAVAGLLSWRFPLVIAAIGILAASLGVGWTASRLTED